MIVDRASTFSDPEIIELLKTRFIPAAIDQAYQRRQKDEEGEFYRKIASQGPAHDFEHGTTQGLYACGADGTLLFYNNNRDVEKHRGLLKKALQDFKPSDAGPGGAAKADPRFALKPPAEGAVVNVFSKVLGGFEKTEDRWKLMFQKAIGRDHLWIWKDEIDSISRGQLPEALKMRIARCHLEDNTRGEPNFWSKGDVRMLEMSLSEGKLTGSVRLETKTGARGYEADLLGFVDSKDGKLLRFDLIAKGQYWGEGTFTGGDTGGAPKGKFPFAVAFSLATGEDEADKVPPQFARGWLDGYHRLRD